jgi:PAS domain S-box-containing protein
MARQPRKSALETASRARSTPLPTREHLSRVLDASPVGTITVTLDGRIDYANARAAEMAGETVERLLGQSYETLAARNTDAAGQPIPPAQRILERLLRERPAMLVVHRIYVRQDGRRVPVQMAGSLLAGPDGEPDGALLMLREMTDQARADETLQASGQFLEALLKHAPVSIFSYSMEGRVRLVNRAAAALTGLEPGDMLGRLLGEVLPEDVARRLLKNNARVLASGVPLMFSDRLSLAGQERYIQSAVFPLLDRQGNLDGVGGVALDITDRFEAEDALRQAHQLLEGIIRASPLAISALDAGGRRLTLWNPAAERIFGWKAEEVLGAPPPFITDETDDDFAEIIRRVGVGEIIRGMDVRRLRKDGSLVDVRLSVAPLHDAGGNIIGSLGVHEDVTEQREARRRVAKYQRRLRSLASDLVLSEERERRRITVILHDQIGQTLAMAKMRLQVLEASGTLDGAGPAVREVREMLERAIRDTRSLTMDLSPPVLYELGFAAAVEWLLEGLREKHGLQTIFENNSPPKVLAEDVRVALFLAVRELLMNVVKHADAKHVKVSIRRTGRELHVRIADDGKGFDAAAVTAPGSRDAGFGLFNIREHIEHLDGRFAIRSRPGRGTLATLVVPLAAESRQDEGANP